jgi:S-adenosylmethionine:tRNA ribosyltransferase-isomerase
LRTSNFDYDLPKKFIAQKPIEPRHNSKLLVYDRKLENISHSHFFELKEFLKPNDILVINKSRVIPARIFAHKITGGKVEILLLNKLSDTKWEVLVGGKGIMKGKELAVIPEIHAVVQEELEGSKRILEFTNPIEPVLDQVGQMPLPPYIHEKLNNPDRY